MKTAAKCRALSIVEVLVSIAILAVGIFAIAELLNSSGRSARLADTRMQSNALGQLKLEELRGSGSNLSMFLGSGKPSGDGKVSYPAEGFKPFSQDARYRWRADFRQLGSPPGVVEIGVDVQRDGPGGWEPNAGRTIGYAYVPTGGAK
jgi:type II secretory pathway pseudopilin PulG